MEPQKQSTAKDFITNLGAAIALYVSVGCLVDLLFAIINTIYPQVNYGYGYFGSESISWPVAALLIFAPVFVLLQWLLEKDYRLSPEKQYSGLHRWFTYINLFVYGMVIVGDLVTVLYYFLDGQDLTAGFILKVLALLVIAGSVFTYYISDVLGKLTSGSRKIWRVVAAVIVLGSIVSGFSVLGSPYTQRLYKYDDQKVNDLININSEINNYYNTKGVLPKNLADLNETAYYLSLVDSQTKKAYEHEKVSETSYRLCAEFNKSSKDEAKSTVAYPMAGISWTHPAGRHCFEQSVTPSAFLKPAPFR